MKTYASRGDYYCVLLEDGDVDVFSLSMSSYYADKPDAEAEPLRIAIDFAGAAAEPELWEELFADPDLKFFVLIKKHQDWREIAGIVHLDVSPRAIQFQDLHVMTPHRGQHLANVLHEATANYVLRETNCTVMEMLADPDNMPSVKAAESNGYIRSGYKRHHYLGLIGYYRRDLSSLRNPAAAHATPG